MSSDASTRRGRKNPRWKNLSPERLIRAGRYGDLSSFIQRCFSSVNPGTEYLHHWHIDLIAEYLLACERGDVTRLVINMPPRALKSLCVSVAWPAWLLGHDPSRRIIAASYSLPLSLKHSLDCRLVMQSPWYRELFPAVRLADDQNEKGKFMTTARGFRLAVSTGGTVTGEGGNFLILDDPHHPMEMHSSAARENTLRWFDQVFASRLDDKKRGAFVLVMQRLHPRDLSGHLLEKGGWEHLCLPAVAERKTIIKFGGMKKSRAAGELLHQAREGEAELARAKRELGAAAFSAQYQQAPVPEEGGIVKPHWLRRYAALPENILRRAQSWDTASKTGQGHDYSACLTWAEGADGYYLLDAWRGREEYPALRRSILRLAENWKPDAILMEDAASGRALLQDLRRDSILPLIGVIPNQDKITRMAAVSALVEAGRVFLPERAAWLADFESELLAFPAASHDDMADAFSQFLGWVRKGGKNKIEIRRL